MSRAPGDWSRFVGYNPSRSMKTLLLSLLLFAQDESSRQARQLIEKLRSETIEERDEAARKLRELGSGAEEELEKATRDKDPEVAGRARTLLGEGIFRRIEETLVKARTARIKFRIDADSSIPSEKNKLWGTLLLKEGNRAHLDLSTRQFPHASRHLCDGRAFRTEGLREREDVPKNLKDGCSTAIA